MNVVQEEFPVGTHSRNEMIDITARVEAIVRNSGIGNGQAIVFCPHTTAAITINENADPSVPHDILLTLGELLPHHRAGYRHSEGNSDAHCKSSLVGASERVLVHGGRLTLGTWQGIFFCEFDGPRNRKVIVQVSGE
ncbi:MAG: secondary thiamine-phosphate synthase enzyme YjbQ [Sedimentisphaerales bacterium]|jgi:secondary thiamine-phosphate synthase enzyme|nr:secondary thiamine-phosphate synthase enzyme YjbQ [Sedimentisphaerales bacterium]NLT77899.1 YjbQ family protein [Planctomycetota bacterium]